MVAAGRTDRDATTLPTVRHFYYDPVPVPDFLVPDRICVFHREQRRICGKRYNNLP